MENSEHDDRQKRHGLDRRVCEYRVERLGELPGMVPDHELGTFPTLVSRFWAPTR
jgi:hypothetical protein